MVTKDPTTKCMCPAVRVLLENIIHSELQDKNVGKDKNVGSKQGTCDKISIWNRTDIRSIRHACFLLLFVVVGVVQLIDSPQLMSVPCQIMSALVVFCLKKTDGKNYELHDNQFSSEQNWADRTGIKDCEFWICNHDCADKATDFENISNWECTAFVTLQKRITSVDLLHCCRFLCVFWGMGGQIFFLFNTL